MTTYPDVPGHRNIDTSVAATDAVELRLGRLQQMADDAIRLASEYGPSADELATRLGIDRWSVQPRTRELRRKGIIRDSGIRRLRTTGRKAIVWVKP